MALSQCLEDLPGPRQTRQQKDIKIKDLYNEGHRLALEKLVSGGKEAYLSFLNKEKIPSFLSDEEIRCIAQSAVVPHCTSANGEDVSTMEHSISSSMNCSSVTYFPDVSDVEPPDLEIGWPTYRSSVFRGVTQAVAHFQPSYGECIYSCKEAARRMIKNAKKVIAIVTDTLTDLDIFKDLLEACTRRWVPVYILLDESCVCSFVQMYKNLSVSLDSLEYMRVRTITGATYFTRSGVKIVGKVNERFMLVDGIRVATGSYRFSWTDGKLNSSSLIELSGKITEDFDEEFRILYAQSLPLAAQTLASSQDGTICRHLLLKQSLDQKVHWASDAKPADVCGQAGSADMLVSSDKGGDGELNLESDTSTTVGEEALQGCGADAPGDWVAAELGAYVTALDSSSASLSFPCACKHTSMDVMDGATQTDLQCQPVGEDPCAPATLTDFGVRAPCEGFLDPGLKARRWPHAQPSSASSLKDCFQGLSEERQLCYTRIRSKLEYMVGLLSSHRERVRCADLTCRQHLCRGCEERERGSNPMLSTTGTLTPAWNRLKCLR